MVLTVVDATSEDIVGREAAVSFAIPLATSPEGIAAGAAGSAPAGAAHLDESVLAACMRDRLCCLLAGGRAAAREAGCVSVRSQGSQTVFGVTLPAGKRGGLMAVAKAVLRGLAWKKLKDAWTLRMRGAGARRPAAAFAAAAAKAQAATLRSLTVAVAGRPLATSAKLTEDLRKVKVPETAFAGGGAGAGPSAGAGDCPSFAMETKRVEGLSAVLAWMFACHVVAPPACCGPAGGALGLPEGAGTALARAVKGGGVDRWVAALHRANRSARRQPSLADVLRLHAVGCALLAPDAVKGRGPTWEGAAAELRRIFG